MGSHAIQETDCSSYLVGSFLGLTFESISTVSYQVLLRTTGLFYVLSSGAPKVPDTLPVNLVEGLLAETYVAVQDPVFCDLGNMRVYYETYGEGVPILMIHGFCPDHRLMQGCMEPIFVGRPGWKRIYFDLPGMGRTRESHGSIVPTRFLKSYSRSSIAYFPIRVSLS